eukprot:gene47705-58443_t
MSAGCDVISEKPMTTTAEQCRRILETKQRTGRSVRINFNYRYSPPRTQIKELLMSGEIGDVLSVDFTWLLNTKHGADYFRRWHSDKANSGGLMVHKSTHHFDLVNWWLGAQPETVHAFGSRQFYTPVMAKRMGLQGAHQRCLTCTEKAKCSFYFDLAADNGLKELYLDNEKHDGYYRDQCVWRPEINIEDTMNVMVRYDNGAQLNYALSAYDAWEGYHIAFNGTKGRIEHRIPWPGLSAEEKAEGLILPCVAEPRSDRDRARLGLLGAEVELGAHLRHQELAWRAGQQFERRLARRLAQQAALVVDEDLD